VPDASTGGEWSWERVETPPLPSADEAHGSFWNRLGFGFDWQDFPTTSGDTHLAAIYSLWFPTVLFRGGSLTGWTA